MKNLAFGVFAVCCLFFLDVGFLASLTGATTLVVTNNNDLVNGDISCPQALIGNSGPDGISLREALLAVNNCPGPHTITFAPALVGQTIVLTARLPALTQDQVTITGLTSNGQPDITIDASNTSGGTTFFIAASSFTMSGMRIGVPPQFSALQIGSTSFTNMGQPISAPAQISDIRITGSAFLYLTPPSSPDSFAIYVSTAGLSNASVSNVTVVNSTFNQLFEAINLEPSGTNNVIEDAVIIGNTFSQHTYTGTSAVELGIHSGTGNQVRRTRILENSFTGNFQGIVANINSASSSNLIDDTLIARNVFAGNLQALGLVGGVDFNSTNNTIANTRIVNNVIHLTGYDGQGSATIQIIDNQQGTNNQVTGVSFVNNTINNSGPPGPPGAGVWVTSSGGVSGVAIANTIFWNIPTDVLNGVASIQVSNSIINQNGFTGVNGNIGLDPMFVNAALGDFHLQSGSPAIGAGTATVAPPGDLECKVRPSPPAIGAYELGNQPSCPRIKPTIVCPASLQAAIDSAQPGSTIFVFGPCNENLLVRNEKQRITLDGGGRAGINGPSPASPAVNVRGKGILIQGFAITGGSDGIVVNRGSNAVINNNSLHGTGGNGIVVDQLAFSVISNNNIQNNPGAGIFVSENSTARIGFNADSDTVASPNVITNNALGITIANGSSARIVGNTIQNQTDDAIQVLRDSYAEISSNQIFTNGGDGIEVGENSFVQLGEDSGTSIFESPNESTNANQGFAIRCANGGVADGRLGTLNGIAGAKSFTDISCVDSLSP